MADKSAKVMLGGMEYLLRPLRIGDLRKLMPNFGIVARAAASKDTGAGFEAALMILEAAFSRAYPDIKLDDIEATPQEIVSSITAIGRVSGLMESPAGEAGRAETLN